ncbi:MAG: hypothetical protein HY696_08435 [Deltaproteobacteria bacterium]|nr:hypothetical protein [Deltaproteobacteria bacterium]
MKQWQRWFGGVLLLLMCGLASCGSGTSTGSSSSSSGGSSGSVDAALAGEWRILTETIYFDNGLTQQITPVSTHLVLDASGGWQFGSSSGAWSVSSIAASDWTTWAIADYGMTRKVTLDGWNSDTGNGPIDESGSTIDNIWVIYRYTSDTNGAGTVWMKFGQV